MELGFQVLPLRSRCAVSTEQCELLSCWYDCEHLYNFILCIVGLIKCTSHNWSIYIYNCIYNCMYIIIYLYIFVYKLYIYIYICRGLYIQKYIWLYIYNSIIVYIYNYIYIYIYILICINSYYNIYLLTYTTCHQYNAYIYRHIDTHANVLYI